jgi:putative ABC transport system permease protein
MLRNIRLAWRTLAKSPAFTITAIAVLAIGIGANTAIFSVINQVLLEPAGVNHPERVVAVRGRYDKLALKNIPISVPDFADFQKSTQVFQAAAVEDSTDINYSGDRPPERLQGSRVSRDWFAVFGAKPILGRGFSAEEDSPNQNHVAVLAYATWSRLFGRDVNVVGRTITLNQLPYRVVGVMGPEFRWPAGVEVWVPIGLSADSFLEKGRLNETLTCFARLQPGVSFARAQNFAGILTKRFLDTGTQFAGFAKNGGWSMFVEPFTDFVAGDIKTPMLILLGAVGFVLLIACANVAGLMLARASGRARELAIRAALGASSWGLMLQTTIESLLLAALGTATGLALAYAGAEALLHLVPEDTRFALSMRIDGPVLAFTMVTAILSALLFGIAPAWQISRLKQYEVLKEGGRSGTSGLSRQRLRSSLVMGEVALALLLLVGAGLFLRSLSRLEGVSPGFDSHGVMLGMVTLPDTRYHEHEKQGVFLKSVLDQMQHQPGVVSAAAAMPVPFYGQDWTASFQIEGYIPQPGDPGPHGQNRRVSPEYFEALKIPLRKGRFFTDQDRLGTEPVVIIDENLARQYWPNQNPIGKRMRLPQDDGPAPWSTIVGVVGHVQHMSLAGDSGKGTYYGSIYQHPLPFAVFLARTQSNPMSLAAGMRQAVLAADAAQPMHHVQSMESMIAASLYQRRFVVVLLGFFAAVALLLASLGLYGVISYATAQRTSEIGVRMALGAQRSEVLSLVVGQGMRLAGGGALLGLIVSLAFSRMLESELFAVSPFDPITFAATAVVLLLAAAVASLIPAARATRVDPVEALRYE